MFHPSLTIVKFYLTPYYTTSEKSCMISILNILRKRYFRARIKLIIKKNVNEVNERSKWKYKTIGPKGRENSKEKKLKIKKWFLNEY